MHVEDLFAGVREAMEENVAVGHITVEEERVIKVELPLLNRPDGEFAFQRGWGKRPEGIIPLIDRALEVRSTAVPTLDPGGVILLQPQFVHPEGCN